MQLGAGCVGHGGTAASQSWECSNTTTTPGLPQFLLVWGVLARRGPGLAAAGWDGLGDGSGEDQPAQEGVWDEGMLLHGAVSILPHKKKYPWQKAGGKQQEGSEGRARIDTWRKEEPERA